MRLLDDSSDPNIEQKKRSRLDFTQNTDFQLSGRNDFRKIIV